MSEGSISGDGASFIKHGGVKTTVSRTAQDAEQVTDKDGPFDSNAVAALDRTRSTFSAWTIIKFLWDLLFAAPPICFLVYASLVYTNDAKPIDVEPVPRLEKVSKWMPTIFPIVFAAITGNLLKAIASWKLERGISVLSLEFLLSSRTVFSTVTTPFAIRMGAFRIIDNTPNTVSTPLDLRYLEYMSMYPFRDAKFSDGPRVIPEILGVFSAALSSPRNIKNASQDVYGNVKVPMVERLISQNASHDEDGWYRIPPPSLDIYSSFTGIPTVVPDTGVKSNYTFSMETSYMNADCKMVHIANMSAQNWRFYLGNNSAYGNSATLAITPIPSAIGRHDPMTVVFASATSPNMGTISWDVSNATCKLTTSYVEAEIRCHHSDCAVDRIRPSKKDHNGTQDTVLQGLGMTRVVGGGAVYPAYMAFFSAIVNSTYNAWSGTSVNTQSTPLEYYFTKPDSPYLIPNRKDQWRGEDIYLIGDEAFSQRFTQLLNTFWISSVAPPAVSGSFEMADKATINGGWFNYTYNNVTGSMTPDYMQLKCNKGWFAALVIASVVLLISSIMAAVLEALRRGPDLLDRIGVLLRDNPYVQAPQGTSTEGGFEQARRLKNVRIALGDAKADDTLGYLAVGTTDTVQPMNRIDRWRMYA